MEPLAERTPFSEIIEPLLPLDIKPVFVIPINAGKHAKMDSPQSPMIITVSHTDHLRTVKLNTGNVIAY
jgi:hypothetical protein